MPIKLGIAGLPMSGKTTVLDALCGARGVGQKTGGGRQIRTEVVRVEDSRLDRLAEMFKPKKSTPTVINVVDAPGIHDPHSSGTGLGKGYLAQVRDCESLMLVMRVFGSDSVPHPRTTVDPARDLELLLGDMMIDDLGVIEKRVEKIDASIHKEQKEKREVILAEKALLQRVAAVLGKGNWPPEDFVNAEEKRVISHYALFTLKRILVLANVGDLTDGAEKAHLEKLRAAAASHGFPVLVLNPSLEIELAEFAPEERQDYYDANGLSSGGDGYSAVDAVIRQAYDALGFHSFLTTGEDEVRAWTILKGTAAAKASGAIHSDLERGFICAEIVHYDDLIADGSVGKSREKGHYRTESREYIVKDGDILNVRFSV